MKNLLFTLATLLVFSIHAQLSVHGEITQTIETLDEGVGIGASSQYLFNISSVFHCGANGGFIYDFFNGKDVTSFSIPMMLTARYYFRGEHYLGGIYGEVNGGCAFYFKQENNNREHINNYRFLPKSNFGLGYRFTQGYDINLHFNLNRVKQRTIPTLGVKFGYTF